MNRWLVTIIAGSILAGLSWFSYPVFFARESKALYSATYRIRVTEDTSRKSLVPGNPVAATINILSKRLAAATYKQEITAVTNTDKGVTLFDARISNMDDSNRCKELLIRRGLIQFREMYMLQDISPAINVADSILQAENGVAPETKPADTANTDNISPEVKALLDSMSFSEQQVKLHSKGIVSILQVTGYTAEIGTIKIRDTARLGELFRRKEVTNSLPFDAQYCFGKTFSRQQSSNRQEDELVGFYCIRTRGHEKAVIENEDIASATDFYENGRPAVTMEFTDAGTYAWGNLTEKNIGKPIAMLFDNFLMTAPIPQQRLDGPTSIITGDFTINETQELALLISGAALPAGVTILNAEIRKEQAPQSKKLLISLLAFVIGAATTFLILNSLKST